MNRVRALRCIYLPAFSALSKCIAIEMTWNVETKQPMGIYFAYFTPSFRLTYFRLAAHGIDALRISFGPSSVVSRAVVARSAMYLTHEHHILDSQSQTYNTHQRVQRTMLSAGLFVAPHSSHVRVHTESVHPHRIYLGRTATCSRRPQHQLLAYMVPLWPIPQLFHRRHRRAIVLFWLLVLRFAVDCGLRRVFIPCLFALKK